MSGPKPLTLEQKEAPEITTFTTSSNIKIHALLTGWVDSTWHDWIPNFCFLIQHEGKNILVDTGVYQDISKTGYFKQDKNSEWFYNRNFRFITPPQSRIVELLKKVGVEKHQVDELYITHFHCDHVGYIGEFENAKVFTGKGNWPSHTGSSSAALPDGFEPILIDFDKSKVGEFSESINLTNDGKVKAIALYGHTPGHIGVMVEDDGHYWLVAGDATFTMYQSKTCEVCAPTSNWEQAKETQATIFRQLCSYPTALLPAHDFEVITRLSKMPTVLTKVEMDAIIET
ncbi:beta-lactamase-like protein [Globomyces pollinis-pini]|nr:beta-lactamase-like protein [Globomyces pollinis-pini]